MMKYLLTLLLLFILVSCTHAPLPSNYVITGKVITNLQQEGLPDHILKKLESIKGEMKRGEDDFVALLKNTIGTEDTDRYKAIILANAYTDKFITEPVPDPGIIQGDPPLPGH